MASGEYLAAHPAFARQATSMVKIFDVNDASLNLFEARVSRTDGRAM
jgi:hypothetical protein